MLPSFDCGEQAFQLEAAKKIEDSEDARSSSSLELEHPRVLRAMVPTWLVDGSWSKPATIQHQPTGGADYMC
jgi:hypothetical protein